MLEMLPVTDSTISVCKISNRFVTSEQGNLRESIILGIECLVLDVLNHVVSDNCKLIPTSPESLGSRKISAITESEDIGVFLMLEGLVVNVQESVGVSQTSLFEEILFFAGNNGVQVVIISNTLLACFSVDESSFLFILRDLNELGVILNVNSSFSTLLLDQSIS